MKLDSMQDLMVMMLKDLHSAENQLLGMLPNIIAATSSNELRESLMQHTKETEGQVQRLEQILTKLGEQASGRYNKAADALLTEAKELAQMKGEPDVIDAALVAAQQKFEHNEIASYGTAVTFAKLLGDRQAAELLAKTLDEEEKMDKHLSELAMKKINPEAEASA